MEETKFVNRRGLLTMKSEDRISDVLEGCFILAKVLTPMNYPIDPHTWTPRQSLFLTVTVNLP